jgi:hypothetical protein
MKFVPSLYGPFLVLALAACSSELPPGQPPTNDEATSGASEPQLGLFALKASNGSYVSCSMTPDSSGLITLQANRPTVGPNEVFNGWYGEDGRFGIKAPNGRFIAADRNNGGVLVADRDYVGDWETFELVDVGAGLFALKNSNGQFVCAHYELPGDRSSLLVADRAEANEWERFTIVQDPAIGL